MKNARNYGRNFRAAFTLVEMIGVLAVMAILAAIVTPNFLHSIERAAVKAEGDNLHALGGEIALYLRDNTVMPTTTVPPTLPNWTSQLATYSSLNAADILTNKRQMNRLYVPDPVAANQRALLLSSMRTGVALPTYAQVAVAANFNTIWNTADGKVPAAPGFAAWGGGPAPALDNVEYLVIERVNLAAVYRTDLQAFTITLKNLTPIAATPSNPAVPATASSYQVTRANGTVQIAQPVNPGGASVTLNPMYPRDRIDLYRAGVLDSSYVISNTGKSIYFNGTNWIPQ